MSADPNTRSPLVRFFDNFFQDRNIKWMLGVGMLILLGSSLMLVTTHWDHYAPFWKLFVLVGYTFGIFAAGQFGYHHLGLRRTGTGLMALTVSLLPLTFLAFRWIEPDQSFGLSALWRNSALLALLSVNLAFSFVAARRIFNHFLQGSQPTFLVSFLVLCVCGAVIPLLPTSWAPWSSLCLWLVFTAGTVKVNRHVFWLTEEHRLPRIFGFFPIALLGGQFLTLFSFVLARHVPVPWLGLGAVLVAIPILLTADALARVFQQRTGDLVRPLPASLIVPMIVGLGLCATGVCIAATGMPRPYALVPAAALAAGLMAVLAQRTGKSAFVWAMLAGVVTAYNFSPVFFMELARAAVHGGAAAVRESRLPYAFYGLTYLPLLAALTVGAAWARRLGNQLFARPLHRAAVTLALLLFVVSFGHAKAIFPVGLVLTGVFVAQAFVLRNRELLFAAIAAWIAAAYGCPAFVAGVFGFELPQDTAFLALSLCAASLLIPGRLLDSAGNSSIPWSTRFARKWIHEQRLCETGSLVLTFALAVSWVVRYVSAPALLPGISDGLICGLLFAHAMLRMKSGVAEAALIFTCVQGLVYAAAMHIPATFVVQAATYGLGLLWSAPYLFRPLSNTRLAKAFGPAALHVSVAGMSALVCLYYVPMFALGTFGIGPALSLPCSVIAVVWTFDVARRMQSRSFSVVGCLATLGLVSSGLTQILGTSIAMTWIPAAWALIATLAVLLSAWQRRRLSPHPHSEIADIEHSPAISSWHNILAPVDVIAAGTLATVALLSLTTFTTPMRIAGGIALTGTLFLAMFRRDAELRTLAMVVLNWQVLSAVLQFFTPETRSLANLSLDAFNHCSLPIGMCAALSVLCWQKFADGKSAFHELTLFQIGLLRSLSILSLVASLFLLPVGLSPLQVVLAGITFGALVLSEIGVACRSVEFTAAIEHDDEAARTRDRVQREQRVWFAEALVAAGIGYFVLFGVIGFGHGLSMYAVLGLSVLLWILGELASRHERTEILRAPFTTTAMALPMLTVVIGIGRHLAYPNPAWQGVNSLALLMSAGFYFWRGLENRQKSLLLLSAAILNVALALLWRELDWQDPQLFMIPLGISILGLVQLFKQELPQRTHDPLRYVGALVILVSPTFHIVVGSWLHLFTLMVAAVTLTLLGIGLRVRALMYSGAAFLLADLVAMVVRGSIDQPNVLWVAGIALGAAVIGLAAYCEQHRKSVLQRLRLLAAELDAWE